MPDLPSALGLKASGVPFAFGASTPRGGWGSGGGRRSGGGFSSPGGGFGGGGLGGSGLSLGGGLSGLSRTLLIAYSVLFVLELVITGWVPGAAGDLPRLLGLSPVLDPEGTLRKPWSLLTHHFLQGASSPLSGVFSLLAFFFFAGTVERTIGSKAFLRFWISVALGAAIFGQLVSLIPYSLLQARFAASPPFLGIEPGVACLVALFGLLNPTATILFMFVVPIQAKWITWVTVGGVLLGVLTLSGSTPFYLLGGLLAGWWAWPGSLGIPSPRGLWLRFQQRRLKRKLGKFTVIDGGRDRGPTYH